MNNIQDNNNHMIYYNYLSNENPVVTIQMQCLYCLCFFRQCLLISGWLWNEHGKIEIIVMDSVWAKKKHTNLTSEIDIHSKNERIEKQFRFCVSVKDFHWILNAQPTNEREKQSSTIEI